MNRRLLSVLIFALAVSGVATYLIYRLILGRYAASAKVPTSSVVVAARDLIVGVSIREADLKTGEWTGSVPPQAVTRKEDLLGRGVAANIYAGEPILEGRLAPKGAGAGLASMIPRGMRAVALRVNEVVGVAGFVLPGMRVDVLICGTQPGESASIGTQTKTILQNIEVLSAGQNIQKDAENKPVSVPVVNLLVTPAQAETLSLASTDARIQLVLRNPLDNEETKTPGTAMAFLFGKRPVASDPQPRQRQPVSHTVAAVAPPPAVNTAAPAPVLKMEVLQGGKRTEVSFPVMPEKNP